eukprot:g2481.t1
MNGSIACSPMKQPFWSMSHDKRARGARFLFRMQEQTTLLLKSGQAEMAAAHADECAAFVTRNYGSSDPRMLFPLTLGAQAWEAMSSSSQSLTAGSTMCAAERCGQHAVEMSYRLETVLALTAQHESQLCVRGDPAGFAVAAVKGLEMLLRQQLEPHVQGCGDVFGLSLGLGAGLGFGHECGRFGLSCRKLISDRSCSVASFDGHNSATLPCDSPISKKERPGYDAVQMEARHEADACANALSVADLALRIVRAQKLSAPIPKEGISCAGAMNILQRPGAVATLADESTAAWASDSATRSFGAPVSLVERRRFWLELAVACARWRGAALNGLRRHADAAEAMWEAFDFAKILAEEFPQEQAQQCEVDPEAESEAVPKAEADPDPVAQASAIDNVDGTKIEYENAAKTINRSDESKSPGPPERAAVNLSARKKRSPKKSLVPRCANHKHDPLHCKRCWKYAQQMEAQTASVASTVAIAAKLRLKARKAKKTQRIKKSNEEDEPAKPKIILCARNGTSSADTDAKANTDADVNTGTSFDVDSSASTNAEDIESSANIFTEATTDIPLVRCAAELAACLFVVGEFEKSIFIFENHCIPRIGGLPAEEAVKMIPQTQVELCASRTSARSNLPSTLRPQTSAVSLHTNSSKPVHRQPSILQESKKSPINTGEKADFLQTESATVQQRSESIVKKLRKIFAAVDKNGDGVINKRELLLALRLESLELHSMLQLPSHVRQEGESRAQFEAVFSAIDADNNDCVSWDEFAAYFVAEGVVLPENANVPTYVQQQFKAPQQAQIQAQMQAQAQAHEAQSRIPLGQSRLQAQGQGHERVQT